MTKINSYVKPASLLLFTWNQQTANLPIVIVAYLHFPTSRGVRTEIVNATQHIYLLHICYIVAYLLRNHNAIISQSNKKL